MLVPGLALSIVGAIGAIGFAVRPARPARLFGSRSFSCSGHNALGAFNATVLALLTLLLVIASVLAHRAHAGLSAPTGPIDRVRAIIRSDPRPTMGGDTVELSFAGHRWKATVPAKLGGRNWQLGDVVVVSGSTARFPARSAYLDSHHLAGRFRLRTLHTHHAGALPYRWAGAIRSALLHSARGFDDTERTLFAGFVLGDVRSARVELTDDFRASGLSHLVVVSGQNLAFLLAGVQPAIRRVGARWRWSALALRLVVIVGFVFVARFEPSVLRAAVMATILVVSKAIGRPQHLARVLCLSVGLLLLVDPLLIRSVGFGLSVGAVGGIAVLAAPLRQRLHRFGFLASPLSVTLAAQVGTAPLLLLVFDGVPVVSVIANLAALPLAAPIMGWGVVAGLPAGMLGARVSGVVHLPTRFLLDAIALLARWLAGLPLGSIQRRDVVLLTAGTLAVLSWSTLVSPKPSSGVRQLSPWIFVVTLGLPTVATGIGLIRSDPLASVGTFGRSVEWFGADRVGPSTRVDVVVLHHGASAARTLVELRRQRVGAVGLVVVVSGGRPQAEILRALVHRADVGMVLSAPGIGSPPAVRWRQAREGLVVRSGRTRVEVGAVHGRRLEISVSSIRP